MAVEFGGVTDNGSATVYGRKFVSRTAISVT